MKKIIVMFSIAVASVSIVKAECIWSWWTTSPKENETKEVSGVALGLASKTSSINGAQVSLILNETKSVAAGAQVSIGFNKADTVRNGVQAAFVNVSDAASLQLGLICINKKGFLPVFPFFNFSKEQFGSKK